MEGFFVLWLYIRTPLILKVTPITLLIMEFQKFDASKFDQGSINSMIINTMIQQSVIISLLVSIKAKLEDRSVDDVNTEMGYLVERRIDDFKSSFSSNI